jgi:uncharacterized protein YbaP (TraB family)
MLAALLALSTALATSGAGAGVPDGTLLWSMQGERNTVYILGSVPMLRDASVGLTPEAETAFQQAEALLFELDFGTPGAYEPNVLYESMHAAATLPEGQTLRTILGNEHQALSILAQAQGVDLAQFDGVAPWLVAYGLAEGVLARQGFEPGLGIEYALAERAGEAQKRIAGLETPTERFATYSRLGPAQQRDLLRASLEELRLTNPGAGRISAAWNSGDAAAFEQRLAEEMRRAPSLYGPLVVERHRGWLGKIEALLDDEQDWLVVVGAMHLLGPDNLVTLLEGRGHRLHRR